jgi:integrase
LNHAVEDGLIDRNPAEKLGRFTKTDRPEHQAQAMTRQEAETFLAAAMQISPDYHPFFLMALRAGLRMGELIAVTWGDIQFGTSEDDPNRYILVQRNFVRGEFTTPKSKKSRRVDLSRELRRALMELRDKRMLTAIMSGRASIVVILSFPRKLVPSLTPATYFTTTSCPP